MMDLGAIEKRLGNTAGIYLRGGALLLGGLLFFAVTNYMTGRTERLVKVKNAEGSEFSAVLKEYLKERSGIEPLEKRLLLPPSRESVSAIIEEIGASIGLKGSITSYKPFEVKDEKGYAQKGVEVRLEGVGLNQLANLLFRVENYRNLLLVRDFQMKARFDDPDLLDVTMQVVLVTRLS